MPKINLDKFIKVERDVTGGEIVKFLDEGKFVDSQFKNLDGTVKVNLEFSMELNGEEKRMSVNKTSQKNLIAKWGKNTDQWIGKTAKVNIGMTPQGKKCIFLEPIE